MPSTLAFDDFKPYTLTCELRYDNAYLVFDRTGQLVTDVRDSFTNVSVASAVPQQSAFSADEGNFNVELNAARFTSGRVDRTGELFAKHCSVLFDAVVERLEINVFTRIGIRYILRKDFATDAEAKEALASMMLTSLKPVKRFNASEHPTEVAFRWEDDQVGAFVRLKAEITDIKVVVPVEMQDTIPKFEKKVNGLTLDIDYYTVARVEREQWSCREWLPSKLRVIRKEVDSILRGT
jgi:hypothetical protein